MSPEGEDERGQRWRRDLEVSDSDLRSDLEAGMDRMEASSSAVNLQAGRAQE